MNYAGRVPHSIRGFGVALGLACVLGLASCGAESTDVEPTADELLAEDARIGKLIYKCQNDGFYGRDTSDMVTIQLEKLQTGRMDSLRRAREELAAMGDEAVLEVARFVTHHISERMTAPYIQNGVDVLAMSPAGNGPAASTVNSALMRCLDFGEAAVRLRALQALAFGHARPDNFERLLQQLEVEPPTAQVSVAAAMFASDAVRAETQFVDWIENGTREHLWLDVVNLLAAADGEKTVELAKRRYRDGPEPLRTRLAAVAARAGHADAVDALRDWVESDSEDLRIESMQGLAAAGYYEDVGERLRSDPSPRVRTLAVHVLAEFPSDDVLPVLREALEDGYAEVRNEALGALMKRRSPEALDRALVDLGSPNRDVVASALEALREPMEDPGIAQRALDALLAREALAEGQSIEARKENFQFIGLVPLGEAAAYLRKTALAHPDTRIGEVRLHRWMMIQAANTGVEGRTVLAEAFQEEADPLRRIDLIWAISSHRDALSRETFLEALGREESSEYEQLYLIERICRAGPAYLVAPILKAHVLTLDIPEVRRAAQCLLWNWY